MLGLVIRKGKCNCNGDLRGLSGNGVDIHEQLLIFSILSSRRCAVPCCRVVDQANNSPQLLSSCAWLCAVGGCSATSRAHVVNDPGWFHVEGCCDCVSRYLSMACQDFPFHSRLAFASVTSSPRAEAWKYAVGLQRNSRPLQCFS